MKTWKGKTWSCISAKIRGIWIQVWIHLNEVMVKLGPDNWHVGKLKGFWFKWANPLLMDFSMRCAGPTIPPLCYHYYYYYFYDNYILTPAITHEALVDESWCLYEEEKEVDGWFEC